MDSTDCLRAWAESLGGITYPLLSDFYPHGAVAQSYGVLRAEGYSERAIFVIDKQGIVRYVDVHNIDEQPDNDVLFGVLNKLEPALAAAFAARTAEAVARPPEVVTPASATPVTTAVTGAPQVIMYCTPWCPACKRAKFYFQENNVSYQEIDISRDRAAAARVRSWANGFETTPTFDIGGKILVNFDRGKLNEALGIQEA